MIRVVLDTNVLVSAAVFGGKPDEILDLARGGKIQLCTSPELLAEFGGVLARKLGFPPELTDEALAEVASLAAIVEPRHKLNVISQDDADNRVLECALAGRVGYVVSGDSHLRALRVFRRIPILSPSAFLDESLWLLGADE